MKSIRLSLTVYFLILVVAGMALASGLIYGSTQAALEDRQAALEDQLRARKKSSAELLCVKNRAAKAHLENKHEEAQAAIIKSMDDDLLKQATTISRFVSFHLDWNRVAYFRLNSLGALPASFTPNGPLLAQTWVAEAAVGDQRDPAIREMDSVSRVLFNRFYRNFKAEIKLDESELLEHAEDLVLGFFQINSDWGSTYYSANMEGRTFAFDPKVFKSGPSTPAVWHEHVDADLGMDTKVRLVKYKAPVGRYVPRPFPRRGDGKPGDPKPGGGRPGGDRTQPAPRPEGWSQPSILVQCAFSTARRDERLAALDEQLDKDRAGLDEQMQKELEGMDERLKGDLDKARADTTASLASLRNKLLALCGLTVALVVAGTFFFVYLGLSPLSRLSDAVSKVSEKDFRLQMDDRPLPTELQPIAERLSQTLDQLARAFAREKQATADISHELRTPLAALLTTIDVTLRKPRSADEYREALEDCRASGQEINHAVERLLALARLDAGVDAVRREKVDVVSLAKQCVSVVRPLAEANGLALRVEAEEPAPADTDPSKIREILNNLLHNAIQYNRPNGSIDVRVHRENGHLLMEVVDSGIGIPAAARPHIFERFYRADPSRQSDGMHTGLGLAIVKGYVDLMGGSIAVESEEGRGSTFRIDLPA